MNKLKTFFLWLLFPGVYATLQLRCLTLQLENVALRGSRDGHILCLDTLMSLVAINEVGQWSTVFEEDTVLPEDLQDYLHGLVARA